MDPEEKQLIGSILSDEPDIQDVVRKETKKRSRLSLNAKEFQPTFLSSSGQISESYGNDIQSFNSTNSQPYGNHERPKEKKLSIKVHQYSPKKHSTMQPMNPVEPCCLSFNSHPSLEQDNQIKMQLRQDELQFKHCLEQLCGNQNASRNLQKIFDNGSQHQRRLIYEAIEKNLIKTTKDLFGNYLVQKVFLSGERSWKFNLFNQLRGHIGELCKIQYASRVLNRMIEFLKDEDYHLQFEVIEEIKPQIKQLINDNNGCYVLLSILENFASNLCEFMLKNIEESVYQMSQHTYGCRIIQFVLQKHQSQVLLQTIMDISEKLCICEFGNYIIQFILKSNFKPQKQELIKTIKNNFQQLSYNKYGSNVVEVFLDVIDSEEAKGITNLMLSQQPDEYQQYNFLFVVFAIHPFANYVIKKYLQLDQRIIMPVLQILKNYPQILLKINSSEFGQKIYPLVERSIQFI